ncbi:hypothetical protein ACFLWY_01505 [Chloroflexota bacterium]
MGTINHRINPITVKVDIQLGPMTYHQRMAWLRFWLKLIAEAKRETVK